jgi:glycosyltransferase involved in cell wall biosynthesis
VKRTDRVGINATVIGDNPTGLGVYAMKVIRELDRLRDDLVVYTSAPERLGPLRARVVRVSSHVRPGRGVRGHLARLAWLQTLLRARARLDGLGVLLNTVPEGVLGLGLPQVTVVHDLVPMHYPAQYPRQRSYFRFLVPRLVRAARVVVADSHSTRRDLITLYGAQPGKIRVIHPGYDAAAYFSNGARNGHATGGGYFVYVGNLLPHKNVLRLLDAFAIVRRRRPCRLVIRGHGRRDYTRAVHERVQRLELNGAVSFVDYMAEPGLRDLYTHALGLVLPSLHEGFGLPILEAMACGLPVITSNGSSTTEVAGDASLTIDPYDAGALADTMHRLLTEHGLSDDLRARGLQRVHAFGWRQTGEQLSAVLDEVLDAR